MEESGNEIKKENKTIPHKNRARKKYQVLGHKFWCDKEWGKEKRQTQRLARSVGRKKKQREKWNPENCAKREKGNEVTRTKKMGNAKSETETWSYKDHVEKKRKEENQSKVKNRENN